LQRPVASDYLSVLVTPLFFILWFLAQARAHQTAALAASHPAVAVSPATSKRAVSNLPDRFPALSTEKMTMFSVYANTELGEAKQGNDLRVRCKTSRALSNIESFVPIEAIVQEDVVSGAGNILIPAGSKIIGRGYCDADASRFRGRGRWTFYVGDHQIAVDGTLWDASGKEGLLGDANPAGTDVSRIKQAIYRDGLYLYVPSDTLFVLSLRNNVSVQDLPSAFEK
jgi:hypothetical protein